MKIKVEKKDLIIFIIFCVLRSGRPAVISGWARANFISTLHLSGLRLYVYDVIITNKGM